MVNVRAVREAQAFCLSSGRPLPLFQGGRDVDADVLVEESLSDALEQGDACSRHLRPVNVVQPSPGADFVSWDNYERVVDEQKDSPSPSPPSKQELDARLTSDLPFKVLNRAQMR